jgi:hypothetical protein
MSDIVAPSWHFYKIMQPLMTVSEWTAASLEVEPLAKKRSTTHALGTAVAVLCGYYPQAEARLSTQRAAVEDAEAAVQEALRRLEEAEVGPNSVRQYQGRQAPHVGNGVRLLTHI